MTTTPPPADPQSLPYRAGVGIMVLNREGLAWVGRRADAHDDAEACWWQMPQGGIDDDEDPERAAFRELFEETSIKSIEIITQTPDWLTYDLPPHLISKVWGGRYRGQRQKWYLVRFIGEETEIDLGAPGSPNAEFVAWRWCAPKDLPSVIIPFKRDLYNEVLRIFAPELAQSGG